MKRQKRFRSGRKYSYRKTKILDKSISSSEHSTTESISTVGIIEDQSSLPIPTNFDDFRPQRASSPVIFDRTPDDTISFTDSCSLDETLLHREGTWSVSEFSKRYLDMVSKHRVSDACASSILDFISDQLPCHNNVPTWRDLKHNDKMELRNGRIIEST